MEQMRRFEESMRRLAAAANMSHREMEALAITVVRSYELERWRRRRDHFALPWPQRLWAAYRVWCLECELRRRMALRERQRG